MPKRLRGHLWWFSSQKRYGRIRCGQGLPDIFVQTGDMQNVEGIRELETGRLVEFSVEQTPTGPVASNIVLLPPER